MNHHRLTPPRHNANPKAILDKSDRTKLADPATVKKLVECEKQMRIFDQQIESTSPSALEKLVQTTAEIYERSPTKQNFEKLRDLKENRPAREIEFHNLLDHIWAARKRYFHENVAPLLHGILDKAALMLTARAEEMHQLEESHSAEISIPHEPSQAVACLSVRIHRLQELANQLRNGIASEAAPSSWLRDLINLEE